MPTEKLYRWRVRVPGYADTVVEAPDRETATVLAARKWRARWVALAAQIDAVRLGAAEKRKSCRVCGNQMERHDPGPTCEVCVRKQAARRMEAEAYARERNRGEPRRRGRERV